MTIYELTVYFFPIYLPLYIVCITHSPSPGGAVIAGIHLEARRSLPRRYYVINSVGGNRNLEALKTSELRLILSQVIFQMLGEPVNHGLADTFARAKHQLSSNCVQRIGIQDDFALIAFRLNHAG